MKAPSRAFDQRSDGYGTRKIRGSCNPLETDDWFFCSYAFRVGPDIINVQHTFRPQMPMNILANRLMDSAAVHLFLWANAANAWVRMNLK